MPVQYFKFLLLCNVLFYFYSARHLGSICMPGVFNPHFLAPSSTVAAYFLRSKAGNLFVQVCIMCRQLLV